MAWEAVIKVSYWDSSQVQTHPFLELGGILLQRHLVLETEVERFLISGRMFCAIDSYPI